MLAEYVREGRLFDENVSAGWSRRRPRTGSRPARVGADGGPGRAQPFAVTQAMETWLAPDDGGGAPSGRDDRREALAISTAQADGRSLTTVVEIERSVGGESALGTVLVEVESGYEAALSAETFISYRLDNNGHAGGYL